MRHPTAFVLLAFAAGSLLHCEIGVPSWANNPKIIEAECMTVEPGILAADIRDDRIDVGSVIAVRVCDRVCQEMPGRENPYCRCPYGWECDPVEWSARCSTPHGYSFIPGRLVVTCGELNHFSAARAVVLLQ